MREDNKKEKERSSFSQISTSNVGIPRFCLAHLPVLPVAARARSSKALLFYHSFSPLLFLFTSFFFSFSSFLKFFASMLHKQRKKIDSCKQSCTRDVHRHTIETIRLESRENEDRTEKERKKQKRERAESQKGTEVRIEMFTNLSSHKSTQVYALCQLVFYHCSSSALIIH